MNNPNAGKDIRSLSGCQENIAKYAQKARQSAKTVGFIGQTAKDSANYAIFFGQSANAPRSVPDPEKALPPAARSTPPATRFTASG
jgi:hypothetical protein